MRSGHLNCCQNQKEKKHVAEITNVSNTRICFVCLGMAFSSLWSSSQLTEAHICLGGGIKTMIIELQGERKP